jgi:hypothetical protein
MHGFVPNEIIKTLIVIAFVIFAIKNKRIAVIGNSYCSIAARDDVGIILSNSGQRQQRAAPFWRPITLLASVPVYKNIVKKYRISSPISIAIYNLLTLNRHTLLETNKI